MKRRADCDPPSAALVVAGPADGGSGASPPNSASAPAPASACPTTPSTPAASSSSPSSSPSPSPAASAAVVFSRAPPASSSPSQSSSGPHRLPAQPQTVAVSVAALPAGVVPVVGKVTRQEGMPASIVQTFSTQSTGSSVFGSSSSPMPAATTTAATSVKVPGGGLQGGAPSASSLQGSVHHNPPQQHALHQSGTHSTLRHKQVHGCLPGAGPAGGAPPAAGAGLSAGSAAPSPGPQPFQRLKVEDALSYLDQVKFKFGNQPQVYNDFLDIMKEFKSQSIDTPGVIHRVSDLFKGHPELIVGFNTFLPPGYKIEVQSNDQGYACQVSVSMPNTMAATTTLVHTPSGTISHPSGAAAAVPTVSAPPAPASAAAAPPAPAVTPGNGPAKSNLTNLHSRSTSASTGTSYHLGMTSTTSNSTSPSTGHHHSPASARYTPPLTSTAPPSAVGIGGLPNNTSSSSVHHNSHIHHNTSSISPSPGPLADGNVPLHPPASTQGQPVEFNHAINYVNKIKNRFQGQPDKYKRFLEILHTYQKEQKDLKEGALAPGKQLTEAEVYSQVAKLFENQDDLLAEFGQFLPDATSHQAALGKGPNDHIGLVKKAGSGLGIKPGYNSLSASPGGREIPGLGSSEHHRTGTSSGSVSGSSSTGGPTGGSVGASMLGTAGTGTGSGISGGKPGHSGGQLKRSPSYASTSPGGSGAHHGPPAKKPKMASLRDVSLAEAGKYGTLHDYAFFDKTRKALKNQEVYDNFLRCLVLFNHEIVSRGELVQLVTPFLGKFPELFRWFKEFVGHPETSSQASGHGSSGANANLSSHHHSGSECIPNNVARQDRPTGDLAMEIDYTTCKRLGASYCALPKSYAQPKCSGRTPLCREVLNDTWVSFPTWSEDSTFVTSRKTQYEEYIYRCEDERFELDVVIETNAATIRVLEGVNKKMSRMSTDEVAKFRLDDCLGGSSPTIHQRALKRIYGDKAADIVEGLKKNPAVAVPVVLRRLKAKEEEWRDAQKGFNKVWREQNEKYYLKSLDHQGINFKQNDLKALRSKSLFNEIETLYDERHEQAEEGDGDNGTTNSGPHLVLPYKDRSVLDDAANLLIHHVKRQTGVHKEDKQRIKILLRHLLPDMFAHPRQQLSDDERDEEIIGTPSSVGSSRGRKGDAPVKKEPSDSDSRPIVNSARADSDSGNNRTSAVSGNPLDESYTLFFGNNNWYLFLRLHQILCERLTRMYDRAVQLAEDEARYRTGRKESTAVALRLKPQSEIEVQDYYPAFLDMVKNVLDGNMDSNAYEDTLREMFGIHAYIAFTLDKVVTYAVRQLQHLVSDDTCQECVDLFHQESKRGATGGLCSIAHQRGMAELLYQKKAENALSDENCFKIYVYKRDCKVTIELLDTEGDDGDTPVNVDKWSTYVERFANNGASGVGGSNQGATATGDVHPRSEDDRGDLTDGDGDEVESYLESGVCGRRKPVFLPRNVRLWRRRSGSLFHNTSRNRNSDAMDTDHKTEHKNDDTRRKDKTEKSSSEEEKSPEVERGKGKGSRVNNTRSSTPPSSHPPGEIVSADGTQCRFNINQYRMVFVVNKENYLYKRQALQRAHQSHPSVSRRLSHRFARWHAAWVREHVTDAQQRASVDWLMGRGEGVVPNRTRTVSDNDVKRPPYRSYNRYRVDRLGQASSGGGDH